MTKKVLIADDESHIVRVVAMKLGNAGYEVLTATDGEEAMSLCLAERPDLIITDYQMPVMTGLEFCRRLRSHLQTKDTPTIMLTARGFDIEADAIAEAGVSAVLAKPFSPRELLAMVGDLLGIAPSTATAQER